MVFQGFRLVFYCSRSVFMVIQGSRFVFHGSKWVFMVFEGFRLVFRGSRWVLGVNHGSRSVFIVTGRFFIVSGGFSGFFYGPRSGFHDSKWIFVVPGWFKYELSAAARSETLRTPKRYSLHLYFGPTIPLGLAGRRPALA